MDEKKSRPKGRIRRSQSIYHQITEQKPPSNEDILNQYIVNIHQLLKNPDNQALKQSILKQAERYPVNEWFKQNIIHYATSWASMEKGEKKEDCFNEIQCLLDLYYFAPGVQITDIDHRALDLWRKDYRLMLADWISKNGDAKNKLQALNDFQQKMNLAIKYGAATPLMDWEFKTIQYFYKASMDNISKDTEEEVIALIELMHLFVQLSLIQQLLTLKQNIFGLDEKKVNDAIDNMLYFDEKCMDARCKAFIDTLVSFDDTLPDSTDPTERAIIRAMETFEKDLPKLAEMIFPSRIKKNDQIVRQSIEDFATSFEQRANNHDSSEASSSVASSSSSMR